MRLTTSLLFLAATGASAFAPTSLPTAASSRTSTSLDATIAVIGASGLTAAECVYQALKEGDEVIGLTRSGKVAVPKGSGGSDADKPLADDKLTVIAGDVTNPADVAKVFEGRDIDGVVVALGGKTSDVGETMLTDGTTNVVNAMKDNGVKRLAVVTSIGAGDSESQAPFFFKILMMTASELAYTSH